MSVQFSTAFARFALIGAVALLAAGCEKKIATVQYTQVGACDAGVHHAWVFFEIGEINNKSGEQDLDFSPLRVRLFAGMDPQTPWPGYWPYATEFLTSTSKAMPNHVLVPHGSSKGVSRFMVFNRWTGDEDGSKEANQTSYMLEYEKSDLGPPVLMTKSNHEQTSWRDTSNCNEIVQSESKCRECHQSVPVVSIQNLLMQQGMESKNEMQSR